ncbi:hypothetical protein BGW36DRAFT_300942 [Talaromyces proteolyticus]|uniref:Uncharacterized protein n=1 Tax=Talaromyces proteolyticus TaxID=1131652 RepID=A0AAD4KKX7_9EURO|nr:uncharacterized protein BGW36DRAFT_300942 [Talaromyces proteolyticus]KAH8693546.1 hypothetical protein BGW36DRAFT_300942 [Talaromyces proteolyticus]
MVFAPSISPKACVLFLAICWSTQAQNCILTVPPNPLTAKGLATPYVVSGCNQIDFENEGSFVEAVIYNPANHQLSVYHPLVVNEGSVQGTDYIQPIKPTVASGATVGIWFGSNALTLTLTGATNNCVNGLENSIFGQFAHCNGDVFMKAAAGSIGVPSPGQAADGTQCPTTRDFRVVDMDQSDNVDTTYLLINGKVLAQNTAENNKANPDAEVLSNGSDNALINDFIAPALGCSPWQVQSPTAPGGISSSLATNELQANSFPPRNGPALVPLNDDFAYINNNGMITQSLQKTNLYRAGVGQPLANNMANASGTTYCKNFAASGVFIANNQDNFANKASPMTAVATNLYTFLAQRFAAAFGPLPALGCTTIFGVDNPVTLTTDGNGVVTAAVINTKTCNNILRGQIQPGSGGKNQLSSDIQVQSVTTSIITQTSSLAAKFHTSVKPTHRMRTSPSTSKSRRAVKTSEPARHIRSGVPGEWRRRHRLS